MWIEHKTIAKATMSESQTRPSGYGYWWAALFLSGLVGIAVLNPNQNMAEAMGRILGLLVGSAALTGVPLVICSLLGRPMNMKQQMSAFTAAWILVLTAQFFVKRSPEGGDLTTWWQRGSPSRPVQLPRSELRKIRGTAEILRLEGITPYNSFSPTLYNGTEWTLIDVDIELRWNSSNRIFRFQCSRINPVTKTVEDEQMPAYSTVKPSAEDGNFLAEAKDGEWSWQIVGARGFKR